MNEKSNFPLTINVKNKSRVNKTVQTGNYLVLWVCKNICHVNSQGKVFLSSFGKNNIKLELAENI